MEDSFSGVEVKDKEVDHTSMCTGLHLLIDTSRISCHLLTCQMKYVPAIHHNTMTTKTVKQQFGLSATNSYHASGTITVQL
jgi:hypothetical protein